MRPVFAAAKAGPKRVIYAEGEDERVLRAVQVVVDEKLARPILIGRPTSSNAHQALRLRLAAARTSRSSIPRATRATARSGPSITKPWAVTV